MKIRTMNPFPEDPIPRSRPHAHAPMPSAPPSGQAADSGLLKAINGLKKDDYILIGMIAVLFFEGCDDYILLAALGYLFVMGIL